MMFYFFTLLFCFILWETNSSVPSTCKLCLETSSYKWCRDNTNPKSGTWWNTNTYNDTWDGNNNGYNCSDNGLSESMNKKKLLCPIDHGIWGQQIKWMYLGAKSINFKSNLIGPNDVWWYKVELVGVKYDTFEIVLSNFFNGYIEIYNYKNYGYYELHSLLNNHDKAIVSLQNDDKAIYLLVESFNSGAEVEVIIHGKNNSSKTLLIIIIVFTSIFVGWGIILLLSGGVMTIVKQIKKWKEKNERRDFIDASTQLELPHHQIDKPWEPNHERMSSLNNKQTSSKDTKFEYPQFLNFVEERIPVNYEDIRVQDQ